MENNLLDLTLTYEEADAVLKKIRRYMDNILVDVRLNLVKELPFDKYKKAYSKYEYFYIVPHKYLKTKAEIDIILEQFMRNEILNSDFEGEKKVNIIVVAFFTDSGCVYTLNKLFEEFPKIGLSINTLLDKNIDFY